jgi:hypothetical protein
MLGFSVVSGESAAVSRIEAVAVPEKGYLISRIGRGRPLNG